MNTTKNIEFNEHTENPIALVEESNTKKRYIALKKELQGSIESLKSAKTREMADKELRYIKSIIMSVNVSNRFEDIKPYTKGLPEKIYAVMNYDLTRSELCNILDNFREKIEGVINTK